MNNINTYLYSTALNNFIYTSYDNKAMEFFKILVEIVEKEYCIRTSD